jgi:hypothetical protein
MDNERDRLARQLDTVGWAVFFIWIGVALLADVGWGWGLLGVAAIVLCGELIRRFKGLPVQGFWISVGLMCLVIALWELFAISWPLVPLLIIGFGLVLLVGAFRGRARRTEWPDQTAGH